MNTSAVSGQCHSTRRLLTSNGRFGMTFWGAHEHLGLMPHFLELIELSPPAHQSATMTQGETRLTAGDETFCRELTDVITPLHHAATGVRITSEFGWVTARPA